MLTREIASLTQWMFNSDICNCKRLSDSQSLNSTSTLCSKCGLRTKTNQSGSMTQWIFGSTVCSCQEQVISPNNSQTWGPIVEFNTGEQWQEEQNTDKERVSGFRLGLESCSILLTLLILIGIGFLAVQNNQPKGNTNETIKATGNYERREITAIEILALPNQALNDKYLKQLGGKVHKSPLRLDLSMSDISNEGLKHLESLPIEKIDVSFTQIDDRGLASIARLKGLDSLRLQGCVVTTEGLSSLLQSLPNLIVLNLSGVTVSNEVLEKIAQMKQLETLILAGSPGIKRQGLSQLTSLANLKHLYLRGSNITREHMPEIAKLKSLVRLSLTDNGLGDESIRDLNKLKNLQVLLLAGSKISDDGLIALAKLPSLIELEIADNPKITVKGKGKFRSLKPACQLTLARGSSSY